MKKFTWLVLLLQTISTFTIAQNVGIGTATPAERLHVAGNIKADTVKSTGIKMTTNAGDGKILTSDSAGNATWQVQSLGNPAGGVGFGSFGDCNTTGVSEYLPIADTGAKVNEQFGASVAISGNFAAAGAPAANQFTGYVNMYQFNGTVWNFIQKLTDPSVDSGFGVNMAISGNLLIVGSPLDKVGANFGQGSATIFQFNGAQWIKVQKLTDPNGSASAAFGFRVAISKDFAFVTSLFEKVGANANQGTVSIFKFNGTSYVPMQKLVDPTGIAGAGFGSSVSFSGNFAVVGAFADQVGANAAQGSASILQLNGGIWEIVKKLTDPTGIANSQFGASVSMSGNSMAIGEPQDVRGGSASIYTLTNNQWDLTQKIRDNDSTHSVQFGTAVSMSGDYLLVGDQSRSVDQVKAPGTGSASLFTRVGLEWAEYQLITDPKVQNNSLFGRVLAVEGNTKRFLIGSIFYANGSGKIIFGKIN